MGALDPVAVQIDDSAWLSLWTTQQTVRKLQRSSDNSRFKRGVVMVIGVGMTMMMGEVRVVEAMMSVRCGGVHDARVLGV